MAKAFSRKTQRDRLKKNVQKLQKAGLLGPVNFNDKASKIAAIRRIEKYRSVLAGHATAVKAPDLKTAARLRKQLGLKGSGRTIVVPREKHERYTFQKSTSEIVSTRPGYNPGEKIKKTLGPKFLAAPEKGSGKRLYYTIPERTRGAGRLKRKTFANFDEFLYYISSYDISFEDIEDRIEIEEIRTGSRKDKQLQTKIHDERARAVARYKRKKRKASPKKKSRARKGKRS